MNKDLISREAAVKLLTDKADGYYVSMFATSDECHVARVVALEAANEIESIPAVDAAPVVHGRWITTSDIPDTLICSECGRKYDMYHFDQKDMPFCLCGAKMDKQEKENER